MLGVCWLNLKLLLDWYVLHSQLEINRLAIPNNELSRPARYSLHVNRQAFSHTHGHQATRTHHDPSFRSLFRP